MTAASSAGEPLNQVVLADLEQWLQSRTARDTSDADARFLKALTVAHPR